MKAKSGSFPRRKRKNTRSNKELIDLCLRKFKRIYKEERDCVDQLVLSLGLAGRTCKHCHSLRVSRRNGQRVLRCLNCHRRTWIFSRTFFSRVRRVRPWLMAIWLLEYGVRLCASELARRACIAQSSAQAILKKLGMVLHQSMGPSAELVASLRFTSIFSRRSAQTPAMSHPAAEEEAFHAEGPDYFCPATHDDGLSGIFGRAIHPCGDAQKTEPEMPAPGLPLSHLKEGDDLILAHLSGSEKEVYEMLGDQPLYVDHILRRVNIPVSKLNVALFNLELTGAAKRVIGDCYVRSCPTPVSFNAHERSSPETNDHGSPYDLKDCLNFIKRTFGGVSRKYLQIYLASYWCYSDRVLWSAGRLFSECMSYGPLLFKRVRKFVSPLMVQVMACASG